MSNYSKAFLQHGIPNTEVLDETDIPNAMTIDEHVTRVQDPRPGYALYRADRMFAVDNTITNGETYKVMQSDDEIGTIFPGADNPSDTFAIVDINYHLVT
jgi:hypothetical protein